MSAADHLARAQELAELADGAYQMSGSDGLPAIREEMLQRAGVLAELGRLHVDLHRELILREHFEDRAEYVAPVRGVPEPTPLGRFRDPNRPKRKAPVGAPTEADQHDPNPHQEEES